MKFTDDELAILLGVAVAVTSTFFLCRNRQAPRNRTSLSSMILSSTTARSSAPAAPAQSAPPASVPEPSQELQEAFQKMRDIKASLPHNPASDDMDSQRSVKSFPMDHCVTQDFSGQSERSFRSHDVLQERRWTLLKAKYAESSSSLSESSNDTDDTPVKRNIQSA